MKILFLDIDGVLNSEQSATAYRRRPGLLQLKGALRELYLCPLAVSNLRMIVDQVPGIKIVVSSSWRLSRTLEELQTLFASIGFKRTLILSVTPTLANERRPDEIASWLSSHTSEFADYVIVDDDVSDFGAMDQHLVRTSVFEGLMYHNASKVIDKFRESSRYE